MTSLEFQDIIISLTMRRNYIETGTVTMSANDAIASKKYNLIQTLEPSQKEAIVRMEDLIVNFKKASSKKDI